MSSRPFKPAVFSPAFQFTSALDTNYLALKQSLNQSVKDKVFFPRKNTAYYVSLTRSPGIAKQPKSVCKHLYPEHTAITGRTTLYHVCQPLSI